jgi:tetratricopeptide (TPR) repeat protein
MDDKKGISASLHNLGIMATAQGNFAIAQDYLQQCLALFRIMGDQQGISRSLLDLGTLICKQGDFVTAQDYTQQSLALARAIGDQLGVSTSLFSLGDIAYLQGDFAMAQDYLQQSLALARAIGEQLGVSMALSYLAVLALEHRSSDLVGLLREGLDITLKIGAYPVLLKILVTVGRWTAPQHPSEAARLAGLIEGHPAIDADTLKILGKLQGELEALLPAEELAQYKAEGAALDLETTAREWLARIEAAL